MKNQQPLAGTPVIWKRAWWCFLVFMATLQPSFSQFLPQITIIGDAMNTIEPQSANFADMDGDGDLDVVAASYSNQREVVWFKNLDGLGSFGPSQLITNAESFVRFVTPADMDNDGDMDVVIFKEGRIVWCKNLDGAGTFGSPIFISNNSTIYSFICVADFDGDGDKDIAHTDWSDDYILWYENADGSDNFTQEHVVVNDLPDWPYAFHVSAADVDGDGDVDILSAGRNNVSWDENTDGQGNYTAHHLILGGSYTVGSTINTADFDGDGDLDVVVSGLDATVNVVDGYKLAWFENTDGQGSFGPPQVVAIGLERAEEAIGADLDGDGDQDILAMASINGTMGWFENMDGQGSFGTLRIITNVARKVESLHAADFDGDGDLDVLSSSSNDEKIAWHRNEDGLGNFSLQIIISSRVPEGKAVATADLDGDGDLDALSASEASGRIAWYENLDGAGTTFSKQNIISDNALDAKDVEAVDLDGDGDFDVVSSSHRVAGINNSIHKLAWYENLDGLGHFGGQHVISTDVGSDPFYLADFDGDHDPDILYKEASRVAWFENLDGSTSFAPHYMAGTTNAVRFFPADVDGDQDTDVLFSRGSFQNDTLRWLENLDGQGHFGNLRMITTQPQQLKSVQAADLDGDGDQDVLAIYFTALVWLENTNGAGDFGEPHVISSLMNYYDVYAADLDGDGDLDLTACNGTTTNTKLYRFENQDGYGTFGPAMETMTNQQIIEDLHCADINQDGSIDILAINSWGDHQVAWYPNAVGSTIPVISGNCYFDQNQNQVKDPGETGLLNQQVHISPATTGFTNLYGTFQFFAPVGDYTIAATPAENWQLTTGISAYQLTNTNTANGLDFGFYPVQPVVKVEPVISANVTRCGFNSLFWIDYINQGTVFSDGYLGFTFDTLTSLVYTIPEPDSTHGNSLFWRFDHVPPSYSKGFQVLLQMPDEDHLGDTIHFTAVTFVRDSDGILLQDEQYAYASVVNCGIDPNDKLVTPAGVTEEGYTLIGQELEYTVRFQNTGTDTAFTVRIEDQLDANLDWTTFRPIAFSHSCSATLSDDGMVTFLFTNILLPDSVVNEPGSHGFVKYRIWPLSDLPLGTAVENSASIFFDNNAAVLTNTTKNTLVDQLPAVITARYPSCHGGSDGQITAYVQGGAAPFSYSLDGGPSNPAGIFSNLPAGVYSLTIADVTGTAQVYEVILEDPPLLLSLVQESICAGDTLAYGGTELFMAGNYIFHFESEAGCDSTVDMTLSVLEVPEISLGADTTICLVQLPHELTPGSGFDAYLWSDGSTDSSLILQDINAGGAYAVTVTNANGCTGIAEILVTIEICSAVSETRETGTLEVFPNPAGSIAYVKLNGLPAKMYTIHFQNALGQQLGSHQYFIRPGELTPLSTEDLPRGQYFIVLTSTEERMAIKLAVE